MDEVKVDQGELYYEPDHTADHTDIRRRLAERWED